MKDFIYQVPRNKQVRVIIDTDAGAEADDQFAIIHGLLTPKFEVKGIIAEQFGPNYHKTMTKSFEEINRLVSLMNLQDEILVLKGEECLAGSQNSGQSQGAQFIVEEALKEDDRPLFVLNMGAVTNLAAAYQLDPSIEDKLIAIWIGGGTYPHGHMDFNLSNDLDAANIIMESNIELWQIPLGTYTQMAVSFHELIEKVKPYGAIGGYLIDKLLQVNEKECRENMDNLDFLGAMSKGAKSVFIRTGEGWSLGDSPSVGVLITPQGQNLKTQQAQRFNKDGSYGDFIREDRMIRVYHQIDSRVILEDFFAKIKYHYQD